MKNMTKLPDFVKTPMATQNIELVGWFFGLFSLLRKRTDESRIMSKHKQKHSVHYLYLVIFLRK